MHQIGIEPTHPAPEAGALSTELLVQITSSIILQDILNGKYFCLPMLHFKMSFVRIVWQKFYVDGEQYYG